MATQTTEVSAPRIVTKEPFMLTKRPGEQNVLSATGDAALQPKRKSLGRRKIEIKYIESREKRGVTLSKRKGGLLKKGAELAALCGVEVLQVVITQNFKVYVQTTQAFRHLVPRFDTTGDPITTAFHAYKHAITSTAVKEPTVAKLDAFNGSEYQFQEPRSSFSASSSGIVSAGAVAATTTTTNSTTKKKVEDQFPIRRTAYRHRRQQRLDDSDDDTEGDTIDQLLRGTHIKPVIKHRDSSMETDMLYVPHVSHDRRDKHMERQIEDADRLPVHLLLSPPPPPSSPSMDTRFGDF
jgi:hypothetical protein